jgi:formylglycine-generating enzyme required for sulfatase activity
VGEFDEKALTTTDRQGLLPRLQEIYRTDADPGLHAAAEWLLRTWKHEAWLKQVNEEWAKDKDLRRKRLQAMEQLITRGKEKAPPQWYVNSQGQTMVVIPGPAEFLMGSPETDPERDPDELQHRRRIGRTFALTAKAVTVEEYRKFAASYPLQEIERYSPTADCPVTGTTWFQAAAYCNWLSQQEGLPESEWCYEPLVDPKALLALAGSSIGLLAESWGPLAAIGGLFPGRTDSQYKEGMRLARYYLRRTGYRLPTEAELEYATRAGAVTSRFFGATEDLLENYAWYQKNSQKRTWPVGSKKPNDLGLFDVHGNVWWWCQERYQDYPQGKDGSPVDDINNGLSINIPENRVLRGGSFANTAEAVRSALRTGSIPTYHSWEVGFRPARTFTP